MKITSFFKTEKNTYEINHPVKSGNGICNRLLSGLYSVRNSPCFSFKNHKFDKSNHEEISTPKPFSGIIKCFFFR